VAMRTCERCILSNSVLVPCDRYVRGVDLWMLRILFTRRPGGQLGLWDVAQLARALSLAVSTGRDIGELTLLEVREKAMACQSTCQNWAAPLYPPVSIDTTMKQTVFVMLLLMSGTFWCSSNLVLVVFSQH